MRAHVHLTLQEQDPAQDRVGVPGLFLHLVVHALMQRLQALVLVLARVQEILVARGQLPAQQFPEACNDFGVALHGAAPVWISSQCAASRIPVLQSESLATGRWKLE